MNFAHAGRATAKHTKATLQQLDELEKDAALKRKKSEDAMVTPTKRARAPPASAGASTGGGQAVLTLVIDGVEHKKQYGIKRNQWEKNSGICNVCNTHG